MKRISPLLITLFSLLSFPLFAQMKHVTECDLQGWIKHRQNGATGIISFTNGPGNPPLGKGSVEFNSADKKIIRLKNNDFVGTPLSSLTKLSFATYVTERSNDIDNVNIILSVDEDNDGDFDFPLVFNTQYQTGNYVNGFPDQGPSVKNQWQTWDLLAGGWWVGSPAPDPDHNGELHTLSYYSQLHPNAVIRNPTEPGAGAMRINGGSPVFNGSFTGYVDAFIIGINGQNTSFDFEGDLVQVCHNYQTICISLNALNAHLAHGDNPGACVSNTTQASTDEYNPGKYDLMLSNSPNPANNQTILQYSLPFTVKISIRIYNGDGKIICNPVNRIESEGVHQFLLNTKDYPAGIYFYRLVLTEGNKTVIKTNRLVIVK